MVLKNSILYWEKIGHSYYTNINGICQFGSYSADSLTIIPNSVIIDGDTGVGMYLLKEYDFLYKTLIYG